MMRTEIRAREPLYSSEDVTKSVYQRDPYNQHPNCDTDNRAGLALKAVDAKPLVMWTISRDGSGYLASARIAVPRP